MRISGIKERKKLGIVPTGKLDIAILDPVHEVLTSEGIGIIRTAEIITQENERIKKLKEEAPLREAAATKFQALARGFLARKKSPSDETLSTISGDSVTISPELHSAREEFEKHGGRRRLESLDPAKTKKEKKPKLRNGRGRSASI